MKIQKILIANRGEIANRIIKTCKKMGIQSVAIYSDADVNSLHKLNADESVYIGNSPASDSYLKINKIIEIAKDIGADAIHPGYGFLSENAEFCKKVTKAGIIFIGPDADAISHLGSKVQSRITMLDSNVPVIPGMKSASNDIIEYETQAEMIKYPVLIKASMGGGGKGMRVVYKKEELKDALDSSKREALASFGDDQVFLEKYIESPRHIEVQVARDKFGKSIHLFERECSIQRRHQKIIEESPSTALTDELRAVMGQTAIKAIEAVNYHSLATVEFLLDKHDKYYFLEVNTRIQVEHPITEMTTGIDLVEMQIKIAQGDKLSVKQDDLKQNGHSIECRIYAEDAENNFMPSTGKVLYLNTPVGNSIRYDSGIKKNDDISIYYDPILAKLIVWGVNRDIAIKNMQSALKNHILLGVRTSTSFMNNILSHSKFKKGETFTNFIDTYSSDLLDTNEFLKLEALATSFFKYFINKENIKSKNSVWYEIGNWSLSAENNFETNTLKYELTNNNEATVKVNNLNYKIYFIQNKNKLYLNIDGYYFEFPINTVDYYLNNIESNEDVDIIKSTTPGKVIEVLVKNGDKVNDGDKLIIVEAMKMETAFYSSITGIVKSVFTKAGSQVDTGEELIIIEK